MMSAHLKWGNVNAALADTINVYRSVVPMDLTDLPAIFTTLPGTATEYTDESVFIGVLYYYRLEFIHGSYRYVSDEYQYIEYPTTGPGPSELWFGTPEDGYYGTFTSSEFATFGELFTLIAPGSGGNNSDAGQRVWDKFSFNGKVLLFPRDYLGVNVRYPTLISNNLVNGGAEGKVIEVGDHRYIVRLPIISASGDPTAYASAVEAGSEWTRLTRIYSNDWANVAWSTNGYLVVANLRNSLNVNHITTASLTSTTAAGFTANLYWRPILELVV